MNIMKQDKNKKIAIITFHQAKNYGALLQTYALQKTLCYIYPDYTIEILDYQCSIIICNNRLLKTSGIKQFLKSIVLMPLRYLKSRRFDAFINNNIQLSKPYKRDQLLEAEQYYDLFITGSDQVWNYKLTDYDSSFFLDFVKDSQKKASYAASFGTQNAFIQNYTVVMPFLKTFNNISLREPIGLDKITDELGLSPEISIDPTFLLTKEEWLSLTNVPPNKKYILIYSVSTSTKLTTYAKNLAYLKDLDIIYINGPFLSEYPIKVKHSLSPQQFLTLFANAEYVLTSSFHGTAFSIIFERKFFIEFGEGEHFNTRSHNLLEKLGIKNRELDVLELGLCDDEPNWDAVRAKLDFERSKSFDYLRSLIKN